MGKKQEIINAAYKLFTEKGYSLSMSEIAKAVRIKTPSIYSHFQSKEEMIELTIKTEMEHYFYTIRKRIEGLGGKSCEEKLKEILHFIIYYFKENGRLRFLRNIPLLQNNDLKNMSKVFIQSHEKYLIQEIRSCFEKGIKDGEIKVTVGEGAICLYFAMLQGILDVMLFQQDNWITIEKFSALAWESFWDGIKAEKVLEGES